MSNIHIHIHTEKDTESPGARTNCSVLQQMRTASSGQEVWDRGESGSVTGLHLRVLQDGTKNFFLYYRTKSGTQRRPKLGKFGILTLSEARLQAKKLLARVAIGEDPKNAWNELRAELTIHELFQEVWAKHWSKKEFTTSGWAQEVLQNYNNHVAKTFASMKLSEVTAAKVRAWHASFSQTPYAANRSLAVLSKMFSYAEERELKPQGTNPCAIVKLHKERKRKRFATEDEIKKIGEILKRESLRHPRPVAFIYLLLFSGSRPRAIERARWEDLQKVTLNGETFGVLTFNGKTTRETGEEETVIIPPPAMKIIEKLPRVAGQSITGIKMPNAFWAKIKEEAGCPDLWARDLRRTFATVGMSGGIDVGVIGELLNHRSSNTTKVYAKLTHTARVEATAQIAQKLSELLKR